MHLVLNKIPVIMSQSRNFRLNIRGSDSRQKPSSHSKSDLTLKISKQSGGNVATAVKKPKPKPMFQFPTELTEEELALMSKYQKLKKQKKALLKQKAPPARNESEPLPTNTGSSGMGGGGISGGRPRSPKIGARDAKEIAKKLVKSGTVIIKRAPSPTNEGFKRPLGLERKLISTEKSVGYQPFSATVMEGYGDSAGKVFRKNRYGSPIASSTKFSAATGGFPAQQQQEQMNKQNANNGGSMTTTNAAATSGGPAMASAMAGVGIGNNNNNNNQKSDKRKLTSATEPQTLHVSGHNISEEFIKEVFGAYGKIVKLLVVHHRNYSFVTLDSQEATLRAMNELNDNTINDVRLKVSLARRRMMFNNHRWSGFPGSEFQKYEDGKRDLVTYEEDVFNVPHNVENNEQAIFSLPDDD